MALISCPECGKEVSTTAVACTNCGHPLAPPSLEDRTVIRQVPPPVIERDSFPKWIFAPLAILGAILIFLLFTLFSQDDENQRNINVDVSAKRPVSTNSDTTIRTETEPNEIVIPPSSSDPTITTVPQTVPPSSDTTITQVPADTETVDRGTLSIEAKVSDRTGGTKAVKDEKFYLLDKDLESILDDANVAPIEGQTLKNSFGLSVLYPEKYSKFRDKALSEINKHIKYDVTTDAGGKAQMKDIKPDSYYIFAITKTTGGFAIWSSPIGVRSGQNNLNLSPQPMVEVQE